MGRRALRTLTTLALMAAASTGVQADPIFNATDLGPMDVTGFNNAGQIVGVGINGPLQMSWKVGTGGFLFNAYGPNAGTLDEFTNFQPNGINDSGLMVGNTTINNLGVFSYGTIGGAVTPLPNDAPIAGSVNAINGSGQVLVVEGNPQSLGYQTLIVNPDGSKIHLGDPPNQTSFTGTAINDAGQVVGFAGSYESNPQAVLYSGGTFHNLPTLPGAVSTVPVGINDAGQIVENAQTTSNGSSSQALLVTGGTVQTLGTLGGGFAIAQGISSTGEVYGISGTASGSTHSFLYVGGQMIDLTSMLHSMTGALSQFSDDTVEGINDKNQILVLAENPGSRFEAFLLTPQGQPLPATPSTVQDITDTVGAYTPLPPPASYATPEPSALALFALVAAACAARRGAGPIRRSLSRATGRSADGPALR